MILKIKSEEKCSQEDLHTGMVLMNTQHVPTHNSVIIYAYTVIYKKRYRIQLLYRSEKIISLRIQGIE